MRERIVHDGVPTDVEFTDEGVLVSTGSYGNDNPGMELYLNCDYLAEVVDEHIKDEAEALLEVAIENALEKIEEENE